MILIMMLSRHQWWLGMIIGFANVERNITEIEIEFIYIGTTQILILEFEWLWSGSRNHGSDATG
jgi:hypothetical protein